MPIRPARDSRATSWPQCASCIGRSRGADGVPVVVEVLGPQDVRVEGNSDAVQRRPSRLESFHRPTVWPPSMTRAWPMVNAPMSEHSHRTAEAISSGLPMRPTGSWLMTRSRPSGVPPVVAVPPQDRGRATFVHDLHRRRARGRLHPPHERAHDGTLPPIHARLVTTSRAEPAAQRPARAMITP